LLARSRVLELDVINKQFGSILPEAGGLPVIGGKRDR